jgi:hypothetical protein
MKRFAAAAAKAMRLLAVLAIVMLFTALSTAQTVGAAGSRIVIGCHRKDSDLFSGLVPTANHATRAAGDSDPLSELHGGLTGASA